jgi:hypothetical protein
MRARISRPQAPLPFKIFMLDQYRRCALNVDEKFRSQPCQYDDGSATMIGVLASINRAAVQGRPIASNDLQGSVLYESIS